MCQNAYHRNIFNANEQLQVLTQMAVTMAIDENNFRGSCKHFV